MFFFHLRPPHHSGRASDRLLPCGCHLDATASTSESFTRCTCPRALRVEADYDHDPNHERAFARIAELIHRLLSAWPPRCRHPLAYRASPPLTPDLSSLRPGVRDLINLPTGGFGGSDQMLLRDILSRLHDTHAHGRHRACTSRTPSSVRFCSASSAHTRRSPRRAAPHPGHSYSCRGLGGVPPDAVYSSASG